MRLLFATALLLATAAPAQAQRAPRVHVERVRGPLTAAELRRAWSARAFRRCEGELHADHAHLHVRVARTGEVAIVRETPGGQPPPELACVEAVVRGTRFAPQTEPTLAYVTVFFRGPGVPPPRRRRAR